LAGGTEYQIPTIDVGEEIMKDQLKNEISQYKFPRAVKCQRCGCIFRVFLRTGHLCPQCGIGVNKCFIAAMTSEEIDKLPRGTPVANQAMFE
jgi:rRNA maturation endonuclease Nob1